MTDCAQRGPRKCIRHPGDRSPSDCRLVHPAAWAVKGDRQTSGADELSWTTDEVVRPFWRSMDRCWQGHHLATRRRGLTMATVFCRELAPISSCDLIGALADARESQSSPAIRQLRPEKGDLQGRGCFSTGAARTSGPSVVKLQPIRAERLVMKSTNLLDDPVA